MLKERSFLVRHVVALGDIAILAVLFVVSHRMVGQSTPLLAPASYWLMFLAFLVFYVYFGWTRQLFSVLQYPMMSDLVWRTVIIFATAGVIGAALLYMIPEQVHSRRLYLSFVAFSCVTLTALKWLTSLAVRLARASGYNTTSVLVFGRGRQMSQVLKQIEAHPSWGLRAVRILDLGVSAKEFEEILKATHAEEVLFCVPRSATGEGFELDPYLQVCEEIGRTARVALNLHEATSFAEWQFQDFMGRPTLVSSTVEADPDLLLFKRMFDLAVAMAGMPVYLVSYALACVLGGFAADCIERQVYVGLNGRRFTLYRFARGAPGSIRAVVVKWLRLENVPQFVNVFRGEMSVVGVRPTKLAELDEYELWHYRRLSLKPGMTGLWKVSPSVHDTLDDLVRLDLLYTDSWSIWLDLQIAVRTALGFGSVPDLRSADPQTGGGAQ